MSVTTGHSPTGRSSLKKGGDVDRPWLKTGPVDRAEIRRWRHALDLQSHEAVLESAADMAGAEPLAAGISVIVPAHRSEDHIGRCLESLLGQTLDPDLFEVIVILNGPPDASRRIIEEMRAASPANTVRIIQLNTAGASLARNAGIAAASRQYTTFVDDDDYVSPRFLEVLLAHAGPATVPISPIVDVTPDGEDEGNRYNQKIARRAGRLTLSAELPAATSFNAAKLVDTRLLRQTFYDLGLRSGEDVVLWTTVAVRGHVAFYPCEATEGATYYRTIRPGSLSRSEQGFDFSVEQRLAVMARLDLLVDQADMDGRELTLSKIRSQGDFIGRYLERHPDEHHRVVEAIDRHPVFHLPHRQINEFMKRELVIAFAFPPYADTSAVVMAKRVRQRGRVVDVVSNAMDKIRDTDPSLVRIAGPFVGAHAVLETPSYFANWEAMAEFATEGIKIIKRWAAKRGPYERLYSRAHFAASHFLAAAYKIANPAVRWTAEFSDPLSRDIRDQERGTPIGAHEFIAQLRAGLQASNLPVPETSNCFQWCEELSYALADELVFTNENQMEYMLGYCSNPELAALARGKAVISPHPTLGPAFYSMVEEDYRLEEGLTHLAYFGNFYATRGLDDVLAAVAKQDPAIRERLRVHVFTTKPDDLRQRAAELGISDAVRVGPYADYLGFLNLTTKFDCLIVNDAITGDSHARNPYLPSKWSDYRGSGTAVWGLVEAGSPLSAQPLDYCSPVGDVTAAMDVLARLVDRRTAGQPQPAPAASKPTGTRDAADSAVTA